MATYLPPADVAVSCTWSCHKNRTPPSAEPGTDYATAYGTPVKCAADGTVSVVDKNSGGGEGRRVSVDLTDGRRVSYLHMSTVDVAVGQRVTRGAVLGKSGASGYGSDWYYGPHVHVSLWERPGMAYADTIDFQKYVGEVDDMPVSYFSKTLSLETGGTQTIRAGQSGFLLLNTTGGGKNTKLVTGPNKFLSAVITVEFKGLPVDVNAAPVQLEPVVTEVKSNGSAKDGGLGRVTIEATPNYTRVKVPVSCGLASSSHYLRCRVDAPSTHDVVVSGAGIRGGEFT